MHAYLTRLGIRQEVQELFAPFYYSDNSGNLCFSYGTESEIYGLAFHRVPNIDSFWISADQNGASCRRVIICSSAMEAIAWLNCNLTKYTVEGLVFAATGNCLDTRQLKHLKVSYPGRKFSLLFSNDVLGRIYDLKSAAILRGHTTLVAKSGDNLLVTFRHHLYQIDMESLSLSLFERISGYRFNMPTLKSIKHISWLSQLQAQSFSK